MTPGAALWLALASAVAAAPPGMVLVPAGSHRPFLKDRPSADGPRRDGPTVVQVPAFALDVRPVTTAEFLAFVRAAPQWRRSRAPRLFVDEHYLADWKDDLTPAASARAPATQVSWFAARAYCKAQGRRLPTVDEWEYAAEDAGRDREGATRRVLAWYEAPPSQRGGEVGRAKPNGYGVQDLPGPVWEWTLDFDAAMPLDDPRGEAEGLFCGSGGAQAVDPADTATFLRYAFRGSLEARYAVRDLGFRCARSVTP